MRIYYRNSRLSGEDMEGELTDILFANLLRRDENLPIEEIVDSQARMARCISLILNSLVESRGLKIQDALAAVEAEGVFRGYVDRYNPLRSV